MNSFIIEIQPKNANFDPAAHKLEAELIEMGETKKAAVVQTSRLYRIEGNDLTENQISTVAQTLLVDPVVETWRIEATKKESKKKGKTGWVLDIWLKSGVTDPVGETVEKGVRDLGIRSDVKASSAHRYVFPKMSDSKPIKILAKRSLANELIHDIHIRTTN